MIKNISLALLLSIITLSNSIASPTEELVKLLIKEASVKNLIVTSEETTTINNVKEIKKQTIYFQDINNYSGIADNDAVYLYKGDVYVHNIDKNVLIIFTKKQFDELIFSQFGPIDLKENPNAQFINENFSDVSKSEKDGTIQFTLIPKSKDVPMKTLTVIYNTSKPEFGLDMIYEGKDGTILESKTTSIKENQSVANKIKPPVNLPNIQIVDQRKLFELEL
ncbi:MAG: hypothetical protein QM538_03675 [Methylacidiphilales bacterium]|nr:hypothetical protein [Candidatus Methylacidiphilales bacterium]